MLLFFCLASYIMFFTNSNLIALLLYIYFGFSALIFLKLYTCMDEWILCILFSENFLQFANNDRYSMHDDGKTVTSIVFSLYLTAGSGLCDIRSKEAWDPFDSEPGEQLGWVRRKEAVRAVGKGPGPQPEF